MLGKQLADRRPKSTSLRHIEGDDVNAIREGGGGEKDQEGEKGRKCYNCGEEDHLARHSNCPVKGGKCI